MSDWKDGPACGRCGAITRHFPGLSTCCPECNPPLAPEALYGLPGDFVRLVEPHSEADPVALLVQFLVFAGNAIGRGPYFPVEGDRHGPNLYAVLVGDTSRARKGTSESQVRRLVELVEPDWLSRRVQSGLSSGEGVIHAVRDPVLSEGKVVDPGAEDKRLLVVESEFASTLRVLGRDGNTLSPVLRNAWDGRPLQTLTRNNPARATGAHVSLIGHITREELLRYLTETEAANGFGNRFLWLCVRRSKLLPEGGSLMDAELSPIAERLRRAVTFARAIGRVQRDDEARAVWAEVYPALTEGKFGLLGAMVARSEAQVTRLALLFALLDLSSVVRRIHLESALALWDYAEQSASTIFGEALGDALADQIHQALAGAETGGLTRSAISNRLGRNRTASEIGRALGRLAERGLAYSEPIATGGRPAERWTATSGVRRNETSPIDSGVEP